MRLAKSVSLMMYRKDDYVSLRFPVGGIYDLRQEGAIWKPTFIKPATLVVLHTRCLVMAKRAFLEPFRDEPCGRLGDS